MFEWHDEYALGVEQLDQQHQEIFRLARNLYQAAREKRSQEVVAPTLDGLIRYTASHFAAEEKLMRLWGYPGLADHIAEHRHLTQQVLELQRDFMNGRKALTLKMLTLLADWLTDHIRVNDRRYLPSYREANNAQTAHPVLS